MHPDLRTLGSARSEMVRFITNPVDLHVRRDAARGGRPGARPLAGGHLFMLIDRPRRPLGAGTGLKRSRSSFTESLILAQDERWRRA
jgi:hypothetical protein